MSYTVSHAEYLECNLCPHNCKIRDGKSGRCGVRRNNQGELDLSLYGAISSVAHDPIEKKPLYHFYPGRSILSLGFFGCNFHCPFCQNHSISQHTDRLGESITPADAASMAMKHDSLGIAYTYSEPIVHFEFIRDTAKEVRKRGLKNVLVSNGYISPEPGLELLDLIDAANIDLKSMSDDFYRSELGGSLDPVLEFINLASTRTHLEVTTLIVTDINDSESEIASLASTLAEINPAIPLHLSCYYPNYKYRAEPTAPERVFRLAEIAREHLHYVYPGNVGSAPVNTTCNSCGTVLIERHGYRVNTKGINAGKCANCASPVDIVGF